MSKHIPDERDDSESRDILFLAGGAALMLLGAGLAMSHPTIRRNVKAALGGLMPELEEPLKTGMKNVLPDIERYLKLKSM